MYVASGNAKASKGNFSVSAENITAFMGKTKNSNVEKRSDVRVSFGKIKSR